MTDIGVYVYYIFKLTISFKFSYKVAFDLKKNAIAFLKDRNYNVNVFLILIKIKQIKVVPLNHYLSFPVFNVYGVTTILHLGMFMLNILIKRQKRIIITCK